MIAKYRITMLTNTEWKFMTLMFLTLIEKHAQ